jgi:hypothetical protein
MNIDNLIVELNEKHFSLLSEYSKGNANKEVMELYRSRMKDILGFINVLESLKKNATQKTVVRVAWNREAVDIMEKEGFDALSEESEINHNLDFDEKEFNTPAEANAYIQGIEDGNGWDNPMTEIVDNKIEEAK